MKTKEERNALGNEGEAVQARPAALTDAEMERVDGGMTPEEFIDFMDRHNLIITTDGSEFGSLDH